MAKKSNLTGQQFHDWFVIEESDKKTNRRTYWLCRCKCGNIRIKDCSSLLNGSNKRCRSCASKIHDRNYTDITGQTFGYWYVIKYTHTSKKGCKWFECKCKCGNNYILNGSALRCGQSTKCKSCSVKLTGIMHRRLKNGEIFNQWTIVEYLSNKNYLCVCSCGNTRELKSYDLKHNRIKKCKDCILKNNAKRYNGKLGNNYMNRIKRRANKSKIPFDLTKRFLQDLYDKQLGRCAISGLSIDFPMNSHDFYSSNFNASLDRVDSNKGYTEDNVQWLHKDINRMKFEFDQNYLIQLCEIIVNNKRKI